MEAAGGVAVEEGVMRVLLVDDSPVDRRVAQLLLSSNSCAGSFHVIAVDSAKKAMEFLGLKDGGGKEQTIDMVLTDYCMPEMTGYDLLKAIKTSQALNPLKPIPVIVMSSEDEPQRISRCCTRRAWSSRSTCRTCSSSSCWHTPCCCWASSCTDGHRVAAAPSPCGAPEQQAAKPATVQCSCATLGTNRRLMVQMQRSSAAAAAAPSRARAS